MKKVLAILMMFMFGISCKAMPNRPDERLKDFLSFKNEYNNLSRFPNYNGTRVNCENRELIFDFHNLNVADAVTAFKDIMSLKDEFDNIKFITGKGIHSKNNVPVTKNTIFRTI